MAKRGRKHILVSGARRERVDIMREDWDTMIVLDACRYDYFEKVHGDYLSGTLKKMISPASTTTEWCNVVFQDKYDDVVYVSANPVINSKVLVAGFEAKKHFYKIVDIWDIGWNMRTIHPRELNKAARKSRMRYPDKRIMVHYMQPHVPYFDRDGELPPRRTMYREFRQVPPFEEFRHAVGGRLLGLFGQEMVWRARKLLGVPPNVMEGVWRQHGREGLHRAYETNLRIVLKYVKQLVERLPGKIIVTADHGELLGEGRDYSHRAGRYVWPLLEVPWFEVER